MPHKIKVLIIDDSALIRKLLKEILNSDPMIEVVGTAEDPIFARDKIKALNPDVLTLDIEMPRMDGVTFLRNLMRLRPMPVVMISTLTEAGADVTFEALELGAVDFISKPKIDVKEQLQTYSSDIIEKVKIASTAKVRPYVEIKKSTKVTEKYSADVILKKRSPGIQHSSSSHLRTTEKIIALGASTGGTEAIKEVLLTMPADAPGMVISQHIPAAFSGAFAKRMNDNCAMHVHHAIDGQQILPGNVYIAPGSHHLLVEKSGARYICRLNAGPTVNRHKPSVDVMFRSVVQSAGPNAIGVMLTGMGADGAEGMKEMHDIGSPTVAQDENSSVVWGMPGSAVKLGAVDHIVSLDKITEKMLQLCKKIS
ncbi:MAG: chemotaxis response regulator protein-glutamate methylesterase [Pseudomonadota bacterium]